MQMSKLGHPEAYKLVVCTTEVERRFSNTWRTMESNKKLLYLKKVEPTPPGFFSTPAGDAQPDAFLY